MTVASETNRSGPYTGNGVTTVFDYDFKIDNEAHVKVIKADAAGTETTLSLGAHYEVTGVGDATGGTIIVSVAPSSTETITNLRQVPFTQETDLENQGAYYAETVERAFDLALMRDQQLAEELHRAVKIPASSDDTSGELSEALADGILRLADSADEIDAVAGVADEVNVVAAVADDIRLLATVSSVLDGTASSVRMDEKIFTGDAVTTVFELDRAPGADENVLVWVGGDIKKTADYSLNGVELAITPAVGASVEIRTLIMTLLTSNEVEAIRDKARQWAQEDEDVAVEPGEFSAKHWAFKAQAAVETLAVAMVGGYGEWRPETRAWLLHQYLYGMTEPYRLARPIDDYIDEIYEAGAWPRLDYLAPWFLKDWAMSRINVKNPGFMIPSFTGGSLHVPGVGVVPDGVNSLIFDKSPSELTQYQRDSASAGIFVTGGTSILNAASIVGGSGTSGFTLRPVDGSGNQSVRLNQSSALVSAVGFRDGFCVGSRESSTKISQYRDGVLVGTSSASPTTTNPTTQKLTVFAASEDRAAHSYFIGGGLTADMVAAINSATQTLRATIGEF